AAAACFGIGLGVGYWQAQAEISDYNSAEAKAARSDVEATLADAKRLSDAYQQQAGAGAEERATVGEVKTLSEYREIWPTLYTEIKGALPTPKAVTDRAEGMEAAKPTKPTPPPAA